MMEADLRAAILPLCPRVFPDTAPVGAALPYVVFQAIGGQALRHADNTPATQRHTLMQISVWTSTRAATLTLVQQIEAALCAATAFTARPAAEPQSQHEPDLQPPHYGSVQDFDIWAPR